MVIGYGKQAGPGGNGWTMLGVWRHLQLVLGCLQDEEGVGGTTCQPGDQHGHAGGGRLPLRKKTAAEDEG
jgi:hypothetical protein